MAVAVAVLCGGCVGRQSKEASVAPVAQVGSEYNQHQDQIAAVEPWEESWWRSFNDTVLDALIEDGLESNFDLQSFVYRIEQATALARQSGARLFPTIDLSASDRYEWDDLIATGENKDRDERTAIGGTLRWELDLFGRLSAARRARVLQQEASVQDWLDARLMLSGVIAETYFETKEQKRQLEVIFEQIEINESLLKLTTLRFGQGQSSIVKTSCNSKSNWMRLRPACRRPKPVLPSWNTRWMSCWERLQGKGIALKRRTLPSFPQCRQLGSQPTCCSEDRI